MPAPVGSGLSVRSLKCEKLVNQLAWSRDRSLACKSPMRCGSSVIPIWLRRKAMIGAKSFSDQGSVSLDGEGEEAPDSSWDTSGNPPRVPKSGVREDPLIQRAKRVEDLVNVQNQEKPIHMPD